MEPITRETFNKWAQKNNWMQIAEGMTPQGRQIQFLTPAGEIVVLMLDLKGNMLGIGKPVAMPQSLPNLPTKGGLR